MKNLLTETMYLLDILYDNMDLCKDDIGNVDALWRTENENRVLAMIEKSMKHISKLRERYTDAIDNISNYEDRLPKLKEGREMFTEPIWIEELDLGDEVLYDWKQKVSEKYPDGIARDVRCVVTEISVGYNPFTFEPSVILLIKDLEDNFGEMKLPSDFKNLRLIIKNEDGTESEKLITTLTPTVKNKKLVHVPGTCGRMTKEEADKKFKNQ